ncbi:MAG: sodium:dicarboxylate symporter [Gammaproteobacteria bacterium RIFCSPHIGHO2_12_FULL_41_15]|nr:MAG: sodium:dicarboxylate symporter [Gammaproteobacteria bacterium RIFCSPHIGHO2_12_FULL_41_15]
MTAQHQLHSHSHTLTYRILIGMFAGVVIGLFLKWLPYPVVREFFIDDIFQTGGKIFMAVINMLVVPIVFVSIVCGASALGDMKKLGRIGSKTLLLYLGTTVLSITIALAIAIPLNVGHGMSLQHQGSLMLTQSQSFKQLLISLFPVNLIKAFHDGEMLQIIIFALFFGMTVALVGKKAKPVVHFFDAVNHILMRLMLLLMQLAPYGVLCLIAVLFVESGLQTIAHLVGYFFLVLFVLLLQLLGTYGSLLYFVARLNPITFFKKMKDVMLFAFSVSSSNATIPLNLKTVEEKLGVNSTIASFVIPLGATINMDGSAMMQGVATVFIANAYGIPLTLTDYLTVVLMAVVASIGAAGVPSVGLVTLAMVLKQVGLPIEGISLIIGVDRLLDMARTTVNVCGDAVISCLVAKGEKSLDEKTFNSH